MLRTILCVSICSFIGVASFRTPALAQKAEGEWVKLFNGKNLVGWEVFLDPKKKAAAEDIFQVKDGVIHCEGSVNGYVITKKEFEDYVLKLQWCWGEKIARSRNSGVFVHVAGENKIWPKSIEAQLMADHAGDFWLVGDFKLKVDPKRQDPKVARHYYRFKESVEKPVGEWNQYEITCDKDTVKLVINGHAVNEGTEAERTKGRILLQSEGAEIEFRDIAIKSLR